MGRDDSRILDLFHPLTPWKVIKNRIWCLYVSYMKNGFLTQKSIKIWCLPVPDSAAGAKKGTLGSDHENKSCSFWWDCSHFLTVKIYFNSRKYIRRLSLTPDNLFLNKNYVHYLSLCSSQSANKYTFQAKITWVTDLGRWQTLFHYQ